MGRKRKTLRATTALTLQKIVRLAALGRTPEQISFLLNMSAANVNDLMAHREYKELEATYLNKLYGPIDTAIQQYSASRILEDAAPDAAEALAALLHDEDPTERRLAATAVLDRSGHGPIQRRAVLNRHQIDPVSIALLTAAMRESVVEGEVVDE